MAGVFLSLDGIDGTGKSTQCRLLADALRSRGHEVVTCIDPGGTDLGFRLRELLLHRECPISPMSEAHLFMASRAQLLEEIIRPALDSGKVVISDRYLLANVVYQGHAGGLDPEQLWQLGETTTQGTMPNLTLVLDLPLEVAVTRRAGPADSMEQRPSDYQQRVRQGFLTEASRHPDTIRIIDASPSEGEVHATILTEVVALLGDHG